LPCQRQRRVGTTPADTTPVRSTSLAVQRVGRMLAEQRQVLPGEPAEVEEAADVRSHLGDGRILRPALIQTDLWKFERRS